MANDDVGTPTHPGRVTLRSTPTMDLGSEPIPPRIADRYSIHAQLGIGGMGAVYLVLDHELDEIVALKMLLPELAARAALLKRFR